MTTVKLNKSDDVEVIDYEFHPYKHPKVYAEKLKELMDQKAFNSEEEAKKWMDEVVISMEVYYSRDRGLFMVESEAVDCAEIYDPYTGELCEVPHDED